MRKQSVNESKEEERFQAASLPDVIFNPFVNYRYKDCVSDIWYLENLKTSEMQ